MTTETFIRTFREADVQTLALKIRQYPLVDAAFALQQIEGWQKARYKIPTLAQDENWLWPVRLSMEQCSSEQTARYKAALAKRLLPCYQTMADLTGGAGIDCYFLSEPCKQVHYVEQNPELIRLAEHNLTRTRPVAVHEGTAEDFLASCDETFDLLYIDPARRDKHGEKVFRLADCSPDVTGLQQRMLALGKRVLIKLSPMLDIHEALSHLPSAGEVHIVAVQGEVKEVLIALGGESPLTFHAVNLLADGQTDIFSFHPEEETDCPVEWTSDTEQQYLFEPNAAILKAGAYKLIGQRFGLQKMGPSSHFYTSDTLPSAPFPGRIFRIRPADKPALKALKQANVICRNYPLKAEEVKKKYQIKDGGDTYIIGTRVRVREKDVPQLFLAERLR